MVALRLHMPRAAQTAARAHLQRAVRHAVLLAALSASCSPAPGADVRASDLVERPGAHVGQSLTVSGKLEELHGSRAFTIDSGIQRGELLVLSADPLPPLEDVKSENGRPTKDYTAIVTGMVRLFVARDIEREVGWDIDPELEAEYANKAVLISRTTRFVPN